MFDSPFEHINTKEVLHSILTQTCLLLQKLILHEFIAKLLTIWNLADRYRLIRQFDHGIKGPEAF